MTLINFIQEVNAQTIHQGGTQPVSVQSQFGFAVFNTLGDFITYGLIPIAFSVAGLMVAFYFIIGAFEMITSQGDKAHIVSARAKIYHAFIGLVLLLILYLAVQFVLFDVLGLTNLNII